jgi:hypothetical protein
MGFETRVMGLVITWLTGLVKELPHNNWPGNLAPGNVSKMAAFGDSVRRDS